jgi:divalent metal cation (Fe/Co/Zn/Cd) transporter
VFEEHPKVLSIEELLTMALGPASLMVAARVDFVPELNSDEVEAVADELERQLREAVPEITQVFLDPTRRVRR